MGGGNERRPLGQDSSRVAAPVLPAKPTVAGTGRVKRKEARTLEVDCTQIAKLMNLDAAKPVDLETEIEVVASEERAASASRSGRLAHTKPRLAVGSQAVSQADIADATDDAVPAVLEDEPTSAVPVALPREDGSRPSALRLLPLPPPTTSDLLPVVDEPPLKPSEIALHPPKRSWIGRVVIVAAGVAVWCAAAFVL